MILPWRMFGNGADSITQGRLGQLCRVGALHPAVFAQVLGMVYRRSFRFLFSCARMCAVFGVRTAAVTLWPCFASALRSRAMAREKARQGAAHARLVFGPEFFRHCGSQVAHALGDTDLPRRAAGAGLDCPDTARCAVRGHQQGCAEAGGACIGRRRSRFSASSLEPTIGCSSTLSRIAMKPQAARSSLLR